MEADLVGFLKVAVAKEGFQNCRERCIKCLHGVAEQAVQL